MYKDNYFKKLAHSLSAKGFSMKYIHRTCCELFDHTQDIKMEFSQCAPNMNLKQARIIEQRLGSAYFLAELMYQNKLKQTIFGRHPVISFLFLGIILYFIKVAVVYFLVLLVGRIGICLNINSFHRYFLNLSNHVLFFLPILLNLLIILLCCVFSRKYCLSSKWSLITCCTIIILSVFLELSFEIVPYMNRIFFSIGVAFCFKMNALFNLFYKVGLPILICICYFFIFRINLLYTRKKVDKLFV